MLLNLSENAAAHKEKINTSIGKPFDRLKRQQLGKIDSGKLVITASSIDIYNLLIFNKEYNTCEIELRPNGIIIRFQAMIETYALIIPYYKLKVYKGKAEEYSLYHDQRFIKLKADRPEIHAFVKKVKQLKSEHWTINANFWP